MALNVANLLHEHGGAGDQWQGCTHGDLQIVGRVGPAATWRRPRIDDDSSCPSCRHCVDPRRFTSLVMSDVIASLVHTAPQRSHLIMRGLVEVLIQMQGQAGRRSVPATES